MKTSTVDSRARCELVEELQEEGRSDQGRDVMVCNCGGVAGWLVR